MAEDETQHEQSRGAPPAILSERARWLVWRRVDGRKMPVNPHDTRRAGSSTDPSTWATYEAACEALANDPTCEGLGFVFNGDGVVGVDLDHCTDPETGELEAWARAIVEALGPTYAEWSPSGEGLHIFVLGNLDRALQARMPGAHERAGLEVYATGRFFTWTGRVFEGAPLEVAERGEALARLVARHQPARSTHAARSAGPAGEALEDAQLDADIREALRVLDPGSNDVWQPVAMALHHAYAGDVLGWELLCEWSATDPTYSSRVERQNRNRWRSFGRRTARTVVSVGTLFALAADEGWQGRCARAAAPPAPRLPHPDERWDEDAVCVELGEAYECVRREVCGALDGASELVLRVPPGVGKTHATLAALAARLVEDPELRVAWITRTHATADEAREALRERLREEGAYLGAGSELDRLLGETPVRTRQTCERFDELNAGRHTYPEAVADLCGACERNPNTGAPREAWCPFWEARRTTSARLEVMTHARAMIDLDAGELRADVVVIDENPLDAILTPLELDAGGVAWAADVLGWGREVWAPLVEALALDSELDGVALREHMRAEASRVRHAAAPTRAEQLRHWGTPDQLQAVVHERVEVADRLAARVEAPARPDDEAERLRVALEHRRAEGKRAMREGRWEAWAAEQPPWEAVEALARTAAHGWTQGRVSGGRLHVVDVWSWATRLDTSTLIVLDATMTRAMADALWPDARYVALRVPQPEYARVWWCPLDLTTRDVEGGGDLRSTRKGLVWSALHGLRADARTLHITHKRYRDALGWVGEALREVCEAGAPVLHWRGAETRGWNGGATCTRAVLDTWYMPSAPILQLSEVLRGLARADDHDDVRAHWDAEALHHTRGAEIIQAAHRVRLLRATSERPVDLILAMQDDPRVYGLELHDQLDAGALMWEAHGVCWRGAVGAVRAMLRDVLASTPTLAPLRSTLKVGEVWRAPTSTPILDIAARAHADVLDRERSRRVGEVLESARRAQGWSWEELAAELGLRLAYAYDGDAGAPTPLLHSEGLELGDVLDALPDEIVGVSREPGGCRMDRATLEDTAQVELLCRLKLHTGVEWLSYGDTVNAIRAAAVAPWTSKHRAEALIRDMGGIEHLRALWADRNGGAPEAELCEVMRLTLTLVVEVIEGRPIAHTDEFSAWLELSCVHMTPLLYGPTPPTGPLSSICQAWVFLARQRFDTISNALHEYSGVHANALIRFLWANRSAHDEAGSNSYEAAMAPWEPPQPLACWPTPQHVPEEPWSWSQLQKAGNLELAHILQILPFLCVDDVEQTTTPVDEDRRRTWLCTVSNELAAPKTRGTQWEALLEGWLHQYAPYDPDPIGLREWLWEHSRWEQVRLVDEALGQHNMRAPRMGVNLCMIWDQKTSPLVPAERAGARQRRMDYFESTLSRAELYIIRDACERVRHREYAQLRTLELRELVMRHLCVSADEASAWMRRVKFTEHHVRRYVVRRIWPTAEYGRRLAVPFHRARSSFATDIALAKIQAPWFDNLIASRTLPQPRPVP